MRNRIIFAALLAMLGSAALAAEDTSRTYGNASCTDRNANPDNCVIQDGPPRRRAFGEQSPQPKKPTAPPTATPTPSGGGGNVTILGGPNQGGR
ncbi:MAG TPA: hypothetical protein VHP37_27910 [Burkholderiales bacterium]|nr:hypothetical protein [Burkholderiales bacterium]